MQQLPVGTDADDDFGARGEVVNRTEKGIIFPEITVIWFNSAACLRIIDRENDHRVEAFVP